MTLGAIQFARFALPPNAHGYCGPADLNLVAELVAAENVAAEEMRAAAQQFEGAWPYLQFLAESVEADPLSPEVVEAYWIGSDLLARIDTLTWGNSVEERFRPRLGDRWRILSGGIVGGVPNHAFHVFCVYPWVGLLRAGFTDHALEVIDQCRIRWGTVVDSVDGGVVVRSAPLTWDGRMIQHGVEKVDLVRAPAGGPALAAGDVVALHWDYVCQKLTPKQLDHLKRYHNRHLAIANEGATNLATILE